MYTILKITTDGVDEFVILNKLTNLEIIRYSTYDEAFQDLLSR